MTKPVQQILGGLLVDDSFRTDMTATVTRADITVVVEEHEFGPLTGAELDVVFNMVDELQEQKRWRSLSRIVRIECMNWPCS